MGYQDNFPGVDIRVFNQLGVGAVYAPTAGDSVSCMARLKHDVILQPSSYDARIVETGSTVMALFSDVGEPEKGSTFVIDSTTYTVARITDNDHTFVTMAVVGGS